MSSYAKSSAEATLFIAFTLLLLFSVQGKIVSLTILSNPGIFFFFSVQ